MMRCSTEMASLLLDNGANPRYNMPANALFAAGMGGGCELLDLVLQQHPPCGSATRSASGR